MEDVAAIASNNATLRRTLVGIWEALRVLLVDRRQGSCGPALTERANSSDLRRDDPKLCLLLPAGALAACVDPDR